MSGLANLGNTCSVNTLLQCLARFSEFRECLDKCSFPVDSLGIRLREMIQAMQREHSYPLQPRGVLMKLYGSSNGLFAPGDQHDLSELYLWIMDHLHESCASLVTFDIQNPIAKTIHEYNRGKMSDLWTLMHGIQLGVMECQACSYHTTNIEPYCMLSLDVPTTPCTMVELLQKYCQGETLNDWCCDQCKGKRAQKRMVLYHFPDILVIQLKRFQSDGRKRLTPVDIPWQFEIDGKAKYTLRSIGNHFGDVHGGHYTALIHKQNDEWIHWDDDIQQVGSITLDKNQHSYMFFYEQQKNVSEL